MAELRGNVMGVLRGSLGNITGRVRYGKNYFSAKPASFKMPLDEASVARRAKFKLAVKFCSIALKNNKIKNIWRPLAKNEKLVFQHLVPINYNLFKNNDLSNSNIITPPDGFAPRILDISYESSVLSVKIGGLNEVPGYQPEIENQIKLFAIIYRRTQISEEEGDYKLLSFETGGEINEEDNSITFKRFIDAKNNPSSNDNIKSKIYMAVYTLDENDNTVHYSATFIHNIN